MRSADVSGVRHNGNPPPRYGTAYRPWTNRHDYDCAHYYYFLMGSTLVNVYRRRRPAVPCARATEKTKKKKPQRFFFVEKKSTFRGDVLELYKVPVPATCKNQHRRVSVDGRRGSPTTASSPTSGEGSFPGTWKKFTPRLGYTCVLICPFPKTVVVFCWHALVTGDGLNESPAGRTRAHVCNVHPFSVPRRVPRAGGEGQGNRSTRRRSAAADSQ